MMKSLSFVERKTMPFQSCGKPGEAAFIEQFNPNTLSSFIKIAEWNSKRVTSFPQRPEVGDA